MPACCLPLLIQRAGVPGAWRGSSVHQWVANYHAELSGTDGQPLTVLDIHTHTLYTQACERAHTHTHTYLEHLFFFFNTDSTKLHVERTNNNRGGFCALGGRSICRVMPNMSMSGLFFFCFSILSTNHNVNCTQNRIRTNLRVVQLGSDYAVPAGTGPAILQNFCDLQHKERVSARAVLQQEESLFSPGLLSPANSGTDKCRNFMLHRKKKWTQKEKAAWARKRVKTLEKQEQKNVCFSENAAPTGTVRQFMETSKQQEN